MGIIMIVSIYTNKDIVLRRVSINIWQISSNESLIDYGFEVHMKENSTHSLRHFIFDVPFQVLEYWDITQECYENPEIGKIIFSREFKTSEPENFGQFIKIEMKADGISSEVVFPLKIKTTKIQDSDGISITRITVDLGIPLEPGKTRAFRIRVLAKNVPKRISQLWKFHRRYIFDIRVYERRMAPHKVPESMEGISEPLIQKLYIFIMPLSKLQEKDLKLGKMSYIRQLETDLWNLYLNTTNHKVEDGRKVFRAHFVNVSAKQRVRAYCEFEDPYSVVITKILLTFFMLYLAPIFPIYILLFKLNLMQAIRALIGTTIIAIVAEMISKAFGKDSGIFHSFLKTLKDVMLI